MGSDRFMLVPLLEMDEAKLVALYVDKLAGLTKKQRAVFDLLSNGMLVKGIAKHLGVAVITVSVAKATIMKKLGATSLQELTAIKKCSACQYLKPPFSDSRISAKLPNWGLVAMFRLGIIHYKLADKPLLQHKRNFKMTRSILLAALLAMALAACSKEEAAAPAPDVVTPAAEAAPADAATAETAK